MAPAIKVQIARAHLAKSIGSKAPEVKSRVSLLEVLLIMLGQDSE